MPSYNFADNYRAAGLNPGPEIIGLRKKPFDKLREDINLPIILDLTRLYFGLSVPRGTEWFREYFADTDLSFSMIDNEREASVLASCLLAAALEDGQVLAALAPIITTVGGVRQPLVCPDFIEEARQALVGHSKLSRQQKVADIKKITIPAKSKIEASIAEFLSAPDWNKVGESIKLVGSESDKATRVFISQVNTVISPLIEQVRGLTEEVNMLWWYIGGWSRILGKPFAELDFGLAVLMAGFDLAYLTQGENGPVAAPAILQRLVIDTRAEKKKELTLSTVVDALPSGAFQKLEIPSSISSVGDICPILNALTIANHFEHTTIWHEKFKKATGLETTISFSPLEFAMQVYRESLLLTQVD